MKKYSCIFFFFSFFSFLQAQNVSPIVLDKVNAREITVDLFGNIYLLQEAALYKYSIAGEFLCSYSNFTLGSIRSVDVSNPMKIMLFYRDAGSIVFLNDQLSPIIETLDLYAKNLNTISLATYSTTNNIILFDHLNMDMIVLDFFLNEKSRVHFTFHDFDPIRMVEINEKQLVMNNPATGFYFFDSFGTYEKTIGIKNIDFFQIINHAIYYLKEGGIYRYDYRKMEEKNIEIQQNNVKQVLVYRDKLILLKTNGNVLIY
ncbi:MAG: hypothetical protein RR356_01150 [Bacteroidales bacterium]